MNEDELSDADLWEAKVQAGMPKDEATAYVRGRHDRPAVAREVPDATVQPLTPPADRPGFLDTIRSVVGAQGDVLNQELNAATLGYAPKLGAALYGLKAMLPGGESPAEAYRRGLAELAATLNAGAERLGPAATTAAQLIGSAAPAVLGGGAIVGRAGARAVTAGAGTALGTGAALGGAYGAGTSRSTNPLEVLRDTGVGALTGGAASLALDLGLPAAVRVGRAAFGARPTMDQLAESVASRAGVPGGDITSAVTAAKEKLRRVGREAYGPLEEAHPAVDDPVIRALLSGKRGGRDSGSAIASAAREVMGADVKTRAPSFQELQSIHKRLRALSTKAKKDGDPYLVQKFSQAAGDFRAALEARIPGFADAQAKYQASKAATDAFALGTRSWGLGSKMNRPDQMRAALESLPNGQARDNFRAGLLAAFYDSLSKKGGRVTAQQVDRLQSLGMASRVREVFRSEKDYRAFADELAKTGQAIADREKLKAAGKWLGVGSAAAAGGGLLRSIFE